MRQDSISEKRVDMERRQLWQMGGLSAWMSPRHPFFWVLLAVLLYVLAGFFLAPRLIERAAVNAFGETGRSLKFGAVRVNPFVLSVELRDAALRDTDGSILIACDDAYVNFQLSSLFHWAWTFREFRLLKPYVNLERFPGGKDRISNLVHAFAGKARTAKAEASEAAALPRLIFQHIEWSNGKVAFTDHQPGREFKADFAPIQISVRDLSTLPEESGRQQVSIATQSGSTIAWKGSLQLSPLQSQGRVTVSGHGPKDVQRLLDLLLPFTTRIEGVDFTFDYHVGMAQQGGLQLAVENMTGAVRNMLLQMPDAPGELLRLPQLQFAGGALHWPERKISLDRLSLDAARLNIVRLQDGGFNLQNLLPAAAAQSNAGAEADPVSAWSVDLAQLALTGGAVSFKDLAVEPAATLDVRSLKLSASAISNRVDARFPTRLELQLGGGGALSFEGETGVLPAFSAAGSLRVRQAALAIVQPWIAEIAHVAVASGTVSLDGRIAHNAEEMAGYQGSAHVDGFELTDTLRGEQLLSLQSLATERIEFSLQHRSVKTSELTLTKPYGRIAIAPDKTTNLTDLMVVRPQRAGQPEAAAPALAVTLGGFEVKDANLDFSDLSLPLPFAATIHSMNGKVSTMSNVSTQAAKVQLEGQVDKYGLARISGKINAWSFGAHSDLKVIFRNLETARLSPYTIEFAGYEIDGGRIDLDLDYQIRKGHLQGSNKIISRQLKLGKKVETPGGASLPLDLAVALLTDNQGVIDLDVPISGDINDPRFSIGGVVAKAIFGLIGKIVTSPFSWLGKLVGANSEGFGTLAFAPGNAEISPPDREKLAKLAAAMRQRPALELEVGGVYAAVADRAALQKLQLDAELQARMEAENPGGKELSPVVRRRALEALFEQAFPDTTLAAAQAQYTRAAAADVPSPAQPVLDETAYLEGLRQRLIEHQTVTDAELARLAGLRADAVITALREGGGGGDMRLNRVEAHAVKAASSGDIPLELKVSVADKPR